MLKVIIINTVVYTADSNRAEGPLHAGTFSKKGVCITRGSLYFNFHQKWSKLGTLVQKDAEEAEMKKRFTIFARCAKLVDLVLTVYFAGKVLNKGH